MGVPFAFCCKKNCNVQALNTRGGADAVRVRDPLHVLVY
jgi:hypothetical protein